jgi:hypothetical protein
MKSNRFLFLFLLALVIFSCKKNDSTQITYPSVYHKSGMKTAGDLRVFSSNGEILDAGVISRFNLLDSANFTLYANSIRDDHFIMDSIYLQDPQHAIVIDRYVPTNCLITRSGNRLILTGADTIIGYSSGDEFSRTTAYYIGQIKPEVYTEYLISSTRGAYAFGFTGREKFVLDRSGGQLVAPFILFTLHGQQQQSTSYVNNILQEDFYKNISVGDTISLKKYLALYEK